MSANRSAIAVTGTTSPVVTTVTRPTTQPSAADALSSSQTNVI